ncbi:hypothetical protein EGW08_007992 [Elysia chlorotica]|uniref:DAGKc domain-containing protein n=1 Tax=Elysia chlorotica TaxID=188477 RepID=A0A433TRS3_ELYCH|nr:hypothetical protein EGW08_007992 [Elysia chlorotica]
MTENQPIKQDELPEAERPHTTMEKNNERGELIMSASVKFSNHDMNLVVYEQGLAIEELNDPERGKTMKTKDLNFQWCDVITAQNSSEKDPKKQMLTVHYMEKQKNKALRTKSVALTVTGDNFDSILNSIQDQCRKVPNRPKKLFVLINPIGGNRKGVQFYEKKIAPIFALANCETTVKTSERAKHALEIGETQDFTGYDGIICVSGDGLYQELMEGYLKQLQKMHGVDFNDPMAKLVKPSIPFCLIPAGSSNGTVRITNDGVVDLETSALRVLRGEIHPLNIVTVHEPGKLVGVCGLAFGIGLITDLLKHSDERRWMKKARYVYSIAAVLLKKRRMYEAQVEYILDEDEGKSPLSAEDGTEQPTKEWTEFNPEGKRYACTAFLVSRMVDVGNKTIAHPYSDSGVLVLDTGCSNFGFFKYARTMTTQSPAGDIANLNIKDKALGLRVKILREEASEIENDETGGENKEDAKAVEEGNAEKRGDVEAVTESDNVIKQDDNESSKPVETMESGKEEGTDEQKDENREDEQKDENRGTDKQKDEGKAADEQKDEGNDEGKRDNVQKDEGKGDVQKDEGKGDVQKDVDKSDVQNVAASKTDEAKVNGFKSEAGKKRNKKVEALARATARDSELEHYIYLDGEIRRIDGLQFECRLHSSFIPMFGCVPEELIAAKVE